MSNDIIGYVVPDAAYIINYDKPYYLYSIYFINCLRLINLKDENNHQLIIITITPNK